MVRGYHFFLLLIDLRVYDTRIIAVPSSDERWKNNINHFFWQKKIENDVETINNRVFQVRSHLLKQKQETKGINQHHDRTKREEKMQKVHAERDEHAKFDVEEAPREWWFR
jgi:predicted RND superfamily exporter protein